MNIPVTKPLLPNPRDHAAILASAFHSGILTNHGPLAQRLERELTRRSGAPCCLCANGTLAITLALKALRVKGSVITSAFTFPATVQGIELCGLEPVVADIDYETLLITPETVERVMDDGVGGIVPVNVFGRLCSEQGFAAMGLPVVYDSAHAFDLGVMGDACTYSLHATKLFHTGEGGFVAFPKDGEACERARRLREFGFADGLVTESGFNAKMSELNAAMGLSVLPLIEEERAKRRGIASLYTSILGGVEGIDILFPENAQYYILRLRKPFSRDLVYARLIHEGVTTRRYFWPALPAHPAYFGKLKGEYKNARRAAAECLALPLYGSLARSDAARIAETVKQCGRG